MRLLTHSLGKLMRTLTCLVLCLCVHIDDGYIVSKSKGAIDTFIIDLMKDIHNATLYKLCQKDVGMEIVPDGNHVYVHQNTYIKEPEIA